MKNEYDMIVLMHSTLLKLDDSAAELPFGKPISDEALYSVEGFEPKGGRFSNNNVTPQLSNKKPRQKSAINSESKRPR
jgi:hypothetical protein